MLLADLSSFTMGGPEDFSNFINAVIDEGSFTKLKGVIDRIKREKKAKIISGGKTYKGTGYFIEPTVVVTDDPMYFAMQEEFFGPILTIYVYPAKKVR